MKKMKPIEIELTHWPNHCTEYVARLSGLDEKFVFAREFIRPDRRIWSSSGNSGYTYYVVLQAGIYEIQEPATGVYGGDEARRWFRLAEDGTIEKLNKKQVLAAFGSPAADAVRVDI
jgi:hypothetical protein